MGLLSLGYGRTLCSLAVSGLRGARRKCDFNQQDTYPSDRLEGGRVRAACWVRFLLSVKNRMPVMYLQTTHSQWLCTHTNSNCHVSPNNTLAVPLYPYKEYLPCISKQYTRSASVTIQRVPAMYLQTIHSQCLCNHNNSTCHISPNNTLAVPLYPYQQYLPCYLRTTHSQCLCTHINSTSPHKTQNSAPSLAHSYSFRLTACYGSHFDHHQAETKYKCKRKVVYRRSPLHNQSIILVINQLNAQILVL